MNRVITVILLLLFNIPVSAAEPVAKVIPLPEILRPEHLVVDNTRVYITEGEKIYIYSKKDFKLLKRLGKKGEGPGEFKVYSVLGVWINVLPDYILVRSVDRISYFTLEGKYIKERAMPGRLLNDVTPVGENFIIKKMVEGKDKKVYETFNIIGPDFKLIKEICRFEEPIVSIPEINYSLTNPLAKKMKFILYNQRIYISGREGFALDVYDSKGTFLKTIKQDYERRPVKSNEVEEILAAQKLQLRRSFLSTHWPLVKKAIKLPEYFPAFQDFFISGEKIYFCTYQTRGQNTEFYILDLDGTLLKKVFLPLAKRSILSTFPFFIQAGTLYQLIENEDREEWELHILNVDMSTKR